MTQGAALLAAALSACAPAAHAPAAGVAGGCDLRGAAPPRGGAENVLLVVLDDVGLDKLAPWGVHPSPPTTPRLDALAAASLRFDRAYAEPTCSPTRAALLTGRHPSRTGVGTWIDPRPDTWSLPDAELTLPEALQQAPDRWSTAAIGKWHLSAFHADHPELDPNRQGFDTFRGLLGNPSMALTSDGRARGYTHWERVVDGTISWDDRWLTAAQVDDTLEVLPTLREPWLLYVALSAAHEPWSEPPGAPPLEHPTEPNRYDRLVVDLDAQLGRLLDGVGPELLARTTLLLVSDNGTPDKATRAPWDPARAKATLYEGGVRVPLLLSGPRVPTPGVTDALVHVVDLFSTVLDIAGLAPEELRDDQGQPVTIDGQSLLPLLDGEPGRSCLMVEQFSQNGAPSPRTGQRAIIGLDRKVWRWQTGLATWTTPRNPADEARAYQSAGDEALFKALGWYEEALGW